MADQINRLLVQLWRNGGSGCGETEREIVQEWLIAMAVAYDEKHGAYPEHTYEGRAVVEYIMGKSLQDISFYVGKYCRQF
jgi:hypothetical protein